MDVILPILFYSIPYLIAVGLAATFILLGAVSASRPVIVILPFLLVLYWASEISYGQVVEGGGSLYSKGAGFLLFPAIIWGLVLSLAWFRFSELFSVAGRSIQVLTLNKWFLAWLLLLVAHLAVAAGLEKPFRDAVGPSGFSNVLWIWLFMATLLAAIRTEADLRWLLRFILVVGFARAVFGLVRWAAFGGDPANAYANRHGLTLKLTFFDVYDSLICMLTICVAAVQLFPKTGKSEMHPVQRAFYWACLIVPVACIVLSFRRSAAIGMLLAGLFLLFQLPRHARIKLALIGMPAALIGVGYAVWTRLSQTKHAGSLFDVLFDITPNQVGPDSPRLLELRLAWESFLSSPLFGVGSWGNYEGWRLVSWQLYEGGGGTYLHSGILHIGMKAGILGLILFFGTIIAYAVFWRSVKDSLSGSPRTLAIVGVAGSLFVIPDFIIGTSFTKYRAMLFIGLCMAMPYIGYAVELATQRRKGGILAPALGKLDRAHGCASYGSKPLSVPLA